MKKTIFLALFLLVNIPKVFGSEPVNVAVDNGNPPFMYQDGDRAEGLYPTIIESVFQRMKTPVAIKALPWKRALFDADNGNSGIAGIYKNTSRLKKYDYSDDIFRERLALFVLKERKFTYSNLKDLQGKEIGVIRGWSYGDEFDSLRKNQLFFVDEVKNDESNFKKLLAKRVDCVIAIEESGQSLISDDRFKGKIIQLQPYVAINPTYLIFPKISGQTDILTQFNATLKTMKNKGEYEELIHLFFQNSGN